MLSITFPWTTTEWIKLHTDIINPEGIEVSLNSFSIDKTNSKLHIQLP